MLWEPFLKNYLEFSVSLNSLLIDTIDIQPNVKWIIRLIIWFNFMFIFRISSETLWKSNRNFWPSLCRSRWSEWIIIWCRSILNSSPIDYWSNWIAPRFDFKFFIQIQISKLLKKNFRWIFDEIFFFFRFSKKKILSISWNIFLWKEKRIFSRKKSANIKRPEWCRAARNKFLPPTLIFNKKHFLNTKNNRLGWFRVARGTNFCHRRRFLTKFFDFFQYFFSFNESKFSFFWHPRQVFF